jgi:glycine/D-amino acid oxidase-like deaminating enzyme
MLTGQRGPALVVGAGVAGLATALYLQRAHFEVTVIDALPPASGASFGNAGTFSPYTAIPSALPGMLRKVPGWLMDPLGPLAVRPSYLPRALPYLLRWMAAGRLKRVHAISDAMAALHAAALECWQEMLGSDTCRALIRQAGMVQIAEPGVSADAVSIADQLRERLRIRTQQLGADDLRQMLPDLSRAIDHATFVPTTYMTLDPQRLVGAIAERFVAEGGALVGEHAMKLIPGEGGGCTILTNTANRSAPHVVLAAGAWSARLLRPLGIRLPVDTERGYHAMLPNPSIRLSMPVLNKSRGYMLTPMEKGLRIAGTVEIAGLDAAPNERRAEILIEQARRAFPDLRSDPPTLWMGFRPSTPDSLPILGAVPKYPGLNLVFGHGQWGLSGGPPSGRAVAACIAGKPPPLDLAPYRLERFA